MYGMKEIERAKQSSTKTSLSSLTVRPILPQEKEKWHELMSEHHYLGFHHLIGEAIKYIAIIDGKWVALIGWSSAALHCEARDKKMLIGF